MHELSSLSELVRRANAAFESVSGADLTPEFIGADQPALALLLAARKALGTDMVNWEPESIWTQYDFSPMNRDKLLAAKTLCTHPTLFTEPRGFAAVANTLSTTPPDLLDLTETLPEAMAWATIEGELIYSLANPTTEPEYGPDVTEYIAISLATQGFVFAPDQLDFSNDRLASHLSDDGRKLRADVKKSWSALDSSALEEREFPESAEGVQLARLASVFVYCQHQLDALIAALP